MENKIIELVPISEDAEEVIGKHGHMWEIMKEQEFVPFSPYKKDWLFVKPLESESKTKGSRWVNVHEDNHFIIEYPKEEKPRKFENNG